MTNEQLKFANGQLTGCILILIEAIQAKPSDYAVFGDLRVEQFRARAIKQAFQAIDEFSLPREETLPKQPAPVQTTYQHNTWYMDVAVSDRVHGYDTPSKRHTGPNLHFRIEESSTEIIATLVPPPGSVFREFCQGVIFDANTNVQEKDRGLLVLIREICSRHHVTVIERFFL